MKNFDFLLNRVANLSFWLVALTIPFPMFINLTCGLFEATGIVAFCYQIKCHSFSPKMDKSVTLLFLIALYPLVDVLLVHPQIPLDGVYRNIFIIPIQLWLMPLAYIPMQRYAPDFRILLKAFSLGTVLLAAVVSIVYISSLIFEFDGISYSFMNLKLCLEAVSLMILHRTYLGLDLILGICAVFQLYQYSPTRKNLLLLFGVSLFFGSIIFLTSARIALLCFAFSIFMITAYIAYKHISNKRLALTVFISAFLLLSLILFSQERVQNTIYTLLSNDTKFVTLDPRFQIWNYISHFIDKVPWYGLGTQQYWPLLIKEYQNNNFIAGLNGNQPLSPHNEYLDFYLEYGFIGIAILIAFVLSLRKKNLILSSFMVMTIIAINLLFENLLHRLPGIITLMGVTILTANIHIDKESETSDKKKFSILPILIISLLIVSGLSIKYILKDKTQFFSTFQRYLKVQDTLPKPIPHEVEKEKGMVIDSTTSSSPYGNTAYTYIRFDETELNAKDSMSYIIYVYVTKDFNGSAVKTMVEKNHSITTKECVYDLNRKGIWQKLYIGESGEAGNFTTSIQVQKKGAADFKGLKGKVIFIKPTIKYYQE